MTYIPIKLESLGISPHGIHILVNDTNVHHYVKELLDIWYVFDGLFDSRKSTPVNKGNKSYSYQFNGDIMEFTFQENTIRVCIAVKKIDLVRFIRFEKLKAIL